MNIFQLPQPNPPRPNITIANLKPQEYDILFTLIGNTIGGNDFITKIYNSLKDAGAEISKKYDDRKDYAGSTWIEK